jgi:hypothetical protein
MSNVHATLFQNSLRVLEKDIPQGINVLVKKTRQRHRIPNNIIKDQRRDNG